MDRSLANVISRSRHAGISIEEAINARKSYYTPEADWVNHIIRPWFNDLIPTQEEYDSLFDQAEVILGMLSTDYILATQTSEGSNAVFPIRTCWFGRSMWRTRNHQFNPIKIFAHELNTQGIQWGPLKAGLFGGSEQRATSALNEYKNLFDELSSKMW